MDDQELKEQIQRALNRAYFFLKFRPRTEKEVRTYLEKKSEKYHWMNGVVDGAITSLKENNFINDDDFIRWFVEQRNASKPKGKFVLQQELLRLGVSKDEIQTFFNENPPEESSLALKALERRWSRYQYLSKKERFEKAATFLSRRGFSFDEIKKSIKKLENDENI
jgi:regulatory protein